MPDRAEEVVCGYCEQPPETHGDSDAGPMTVCPRVQHKRWERHDDGGWELVDA